jgi:hypothetical protein
MTYLALGDRLLITKDFTNNSQEAIVFGGGCIASAYIAAGGDIGEGGRLTTLVTGYIDDQEVCGSGCIDYDGGRNSPGPTTLTFAVPIGFQGKIVVSGGRPSAFKLTLVRNAS